MNKCAKNTKSYPQICAQKWRVINNPHVNNPVTHKVIHIFTDLFTITVDKIEV